MCTLIVSSEYPKHVGAVRSQWIIIAELCTLNWRVYSTNIPFNGT